MLTPMKQEAPPLVGGVVHKERLKYGCATSETYSLCVNHAQWLVPRLKRFIQVRGGHPVDINDDEWDAILKKILFAYEIIAEDDWTKEHKHMEEVEEGLDLFRQWYRNLWW
jgi:hypothetical protein